MNIQQTQVAEQRRFLVINFWIGSYDDGLLEGPVLVSTRDYERFHLWDEPYAATLGEEEYQIIKLYPRGLTFDEAAQQFAHEFPWAMARMPDDRLMHDAAFWLDTLQYGMGRRVSTA